MYACVSQRVCMCLLNHQATITGGKTHTRAALAASLAAFSAALAAFFASLSRCLLEVTLDGDD